MSYLSFLFMGGIFMSLRRKKSTVQLFRDDIKQNIEREGSNVVFEWTEVTGATWNETYEVWEGGQETKQFYHERGIGKIVDYKEDIMEEEFARFNVGECIVRFPYDSNIFDVLSGKSDVTFVYQGQRFKIDSPMYTGDMIDNSFYALIVRGVKDYDGAVKRD